MRIHLTQRKKSSQSKRWSVSCPWDGTMTSEMIETEPAAGQVEAADVHGGVSHQTVEAMVRACTVP